MKPATPSLVRSTADAYLGLELGLDPVSLETWKAWHRAMLDERALARSRAGLDRDGYDRTTDWSDGTFRQLFLFMYDASFYDREGDSYRTRELVTRWTTMFGRVDSVLLWHAYPRLGFDERTQFDFYRDMPGGLRRLRADVSDVFHAHGVRVFVDYNPWDRGSYEELAEIVAEIDADGVMLDTMTDAPDRLAQAVEARKPGVVLAPELRPRVEDLGRHRQAWAQWSDVGANEPSIPRHPWIVPRHRQLTIRRWDTSRRGDIVYSFFNGSGLLLWDNVFGTWNPYDRADRKLIAETAAIQDRYQRLFVDGEWLPLVPTGVSGLDANRWVGEDVALTTLRNRTAERLRYRVPSDPPPGRSCVAFWGSRRELRAGDTIVVDPFSTQALIVDTPEAIAGAAIHFDRLSSAADVALPEYDERTPRPMLVPVPRRVAPKPAAMIELPGGDFTMRVRHDRRECGCYPLGAGDAIMWGWFYQDIVEHEIATRIAPFAIRATAVTNAEYLAFVHASGYRPHDGERFLDHLRGPDEALPAAVSEDAGSRPVTFVSLADARAFAEWHGERLPTEAEWQWAAEDAGAGQRFPWGDDGRTFPARLRPAHDPETATPRGILGLSGNAWELTESEHTDGHTRFVMLRGGVWLPPGQSEWLVARGPRPNDSHAKYILLSDGIDRSATVSFRTVVDL